MHTEVQEVLIGRTDGRTRVLAGGRRGLGFTGSTSLVDPTRDVEILRGTADKLVQMQAGGPAAAKLRVRY